MGFGEGLLVPDLGARGDPDGSRAGTAALVADAVDHPLGEQDVDQRGQAPNREWRAVLGRLALGDLLDLAPLPLGERSRRPPSYFR